MNKQKDGRPPLWECYSVCLYFIPANMQILYWFGLRGAGSDRGVLNKRERRGGERMRKINSLCPLKKRREKETEWKRRRRNEIKKKRGSIGQQAKLVHLSQAVTVYLLSPHPRLSPHSPVLLSLDTLVSTFCLFVCRTFTFPSVVNNCVTTGRWAEKRRATLRCTNRDAQA